MFSFNLHLGILGNDDRDARDDFQQKIVLY